MPTARMPILRCLTLGTMALVLFLVTLAIGNCFIPTDKAVTRKVLGHDFLAFYTAGHFLRTGQFDKVYDLAAVREFQNQVATESDLELGRSYGPFWNPPFYACLFAPLAGLPFPTALNVWWAMSLLALAGGCALLARMLPADAPASSRVLLVMLVGVSLPCIQAFAHGQNTFFSFLILALAVRLWLAASRSPASSAAFFAGAAAGLLLYKPQLGLLVAGVIVLTLGRRAFMGLWATGTLFLLLTVLATPNLVEGFLFRMPGNLRWFQESNAYLWERHITFKGFWRLLIQGHAVGQTRHLTAVAWGLSALGLGSYLLSALARHLRRVRSRFAAPSPQRLIAATIASMPLLMPFYFDYDMLLMAIPATLLAAEILARPAEARLSGCERWLIGLWAALYLVAYVSPLVAGHIYVQPATALLAAIATLQIARVFQQESAPLQLLQDHTDPSPMSMAA